MLSAIKLTKIFLGISLPFIFLSNSAYAKECSSDSDCPKNYVCVESSSGKGVCVVDPNHPCDSNGDCPSGWTCISGTCSNGDAGQSCSSNGNCQTGYVCCNNRCKYSTCRYRNSFNSSVEPQFGTESSSDWDE